MVPQGTDQGFQLRRTKIELPLDNASLDPDTQLDLLISYLFVNERHAISRLTRIGLELQKDCLGLLKQSVIYDRRQNPERGKPLQRTAATCCLRPVDPGCPALVNLRPDGTEVIMVFLSR
jgi:hypothetical protein